MSRPLKFCMVTTFYPPYHFGGDAIFVYRLSQLLAEAGHSVDVVHSVDAFRTCGGVVKSAPFAHHENVRVIPLERSAFRTASLAVHQTGAPAFYGKQLRALLDGGGYDVINYHNISLIGGPGVLGYGSAIKLYTTHDYWLVCPTHILLKYDREACESKECLSCTLAHKRPPQLWRAGSWIERCTAHVDRFVFPSRFASERHVWGGLDLPGVVLPHFVNPPAASGAGDGGGHAAATDGVSNVRAANSPRPHAAKARDPQTAGSHGSHTPSSHGSQTVSPHDPRTAQVGDAPMAAGSRPYFLFVGRLERLKGVQDALPAFAGDEGPELLIAGSGTYEAELRRLAQGMPRVRFLGYVNPSELAPLYRGALATLAPSLCYELCPLAAMESMAHGAPVIARDLGAFPDSVRATDGGLLFRTQEELKAAVSLLARDADLRARLGRNAEEGARRLWSPQDYLASYLGLIEELRVTRATARASASGARGAARDKPAAAASPTP